MASIESNAAERAIQDASELSSNGGYWDRHNVLQLAQVYATLAVAHEAERANQIAEAVAKVQHGIELD
jgi:hypothetical protein